MSIYINLTIIHLHTYQLSNYHLKVFWCYCRRGRVLKTVYVASVFNQLIIKWLWQTWTINSLLHIYTFWLSFEGYLMLTWTSNSLLHFILSYYHLKVIWCCCRCGRVLKTVYVASVFNQLIIKWLWWTVSIMVMAIYTL